MRPINQKQVQKDVHPPRIDHDLYILSYPENHNRLTRHPDSFSTQNHITNDQVSPSRPTPHPSTKQSNGRVADRWRNIGQLVEKLKGGSRSKDKNQSACGRLYRLIHKINARFWKNNCLQIKDAAFKKLKAKANQVKFPLKPFNLKESLQMRENQIQKGSKNFELNELMHIVDLHQEEPKTEDAMRNSLSRNLMKKGDGKQKAAASPKKGAANVYILRRKTKDDISTRQDLNSNTFISSEQCLPGPYPARSISPHSVDRSRSPLSVADRQIDLPNAHEQEYNKLKQLQLDSLRLDKSQEIDEVQCEGGSNMRLLSFGMSRPSKVAVRGNRLMNPEISNRKFIFHYRSSRERSGSPIGNEYFPPEVTAKFAVPIPNKPLPPAPKEKPLVIQQATRFQRISSLQVIHPRSIVSHQQGQGLGQAASSNSRREEDSVQSRRCNSMPKITFTYKSREELANHPSPSLKASPILSLNPLKSSKPNGLKASNSNREDPYLSKNIQINQMSRQPFESRLQTQCLPSKPVPSLPNLPQSYYNLPMNSCVPVNAHPNPRPEKLRVFSNYQTQPSTSFFLNQQVRREDYYGTKQSIPTLDTLPSPNRHRIRSTDTYVLSKPRIHPLPPNLMQKMVEGDADRGRARSCGMKIEVVSRKQPMVRVS